MQSELQNVFDSTPPDEPRSRLEPYRELILKWKRQGRSYRRISELMAEKFAVQVAYATVFGFVRRRSRPRKSEPEAEAQVIAPVQTEPSTQPGPRKYSKLSPEEAQAQREFVRALRLKPVAVPTEDPREMFVYDPDKPLIIDRTIKD